MIIVQKAAANVFGIFASMYVCGPVVLTSELGLICAAVILVTSFAVSVLSCATKSKKKDPPDLAAIKSGQQQPQQQQVQPKQQQQVQQQPQQENQQPQDQQEQSQKQEETKENEPRATEATQREDVSDESGTQSERPDRGLSSPPPKPTPTIQSQMSTLEPSSAATKSSSIEVEPPSEQRERIIPIVVLGPTQDDASKRQLVSERTQPPSVLSAPGQNDIEPLRRLFHSQQERLTALSPEVSGPEEKPQPLEQQMAGHAQVVNDLSERKKKEKQQQQN